MPKGIAHISAWDFAHRHLQRAERVLDCLSALTLRVGRPVHCGISVVTGGGFWVAVGTRVAPRPPHRSRRALLTHRAPPSGRTSTGTRFEVASGSAYSR